MSEIKRFHRTWDSTTMEEFPDGDFVKHSDHAAIVAQLEADKSNAEYCFRELKKINEKLEADLAEARKDQARYQWLRNNNGFNFNNEFDIGKFQVSQKKHRGEAWYLYLNELDQAIDAAIKEQQ